VRRFLEAFTRDLVALELGPIDPPLADRTTAWVVTRVAQAGDVTRAGLTIACGLTAAGVRLRTGSAYHRLPDTDRLDLARALTRSRLPVTGELVRAIRSLAVTYAYDARYATAP
jgi:hypothetical protein